MDLSELHGDPYLVGNISDAPADPHERQRMANVYDEQIALKLAQAGVAPDHPAYDALYKETVNGDYTHGVAGLEHGHELPMTKRDAILYAPQSEWQAAQARGANANALLAEYARREPELAQDLDGLSRAVDVAMEWYAERGERPMDNPSRFLIDVAGFHRSGVNPHHDYAHRTSGIGASGGPASGWDEKPDQHPDNDGGMVGEIRALQRARGW